MYNKTNTDMIARDTFINNAMEIAVKAHACQVDKAGQPYILHPLRMMVLATQLEDKLVALLHDVVEDSDWTIEMLSAYFPKNITDAVDLLTRKKKVGKKEYLAKIKENDLAKTVKLLDIDDNSSSYRLSLIKDEETIYRLMKKYRDMRVFLLDLPT